MSIPGDSEKIVQALYDHPECPGLSRTDYKLVKKSICYNKYRPESDKNNAGRQSRNRENRNNGWQQGKLIFLEASDRGNF